MMLRYKWTAGYFTALGSAGVFAAAALPELAFVALLVACFIVARSAYR